MSVTCAQLEGKSREEQAKIIQEYLRKQLGFPWFTVIVGTVGLLLSLVVFYKMTVALFS